MEETFGDKLIFWLVILFLFSPILLIPLGFLSVIVSFIIPPSRHYIDKMWTNIWSNAWTITKYVGFVILALIMLKMFAQLVGWAPINRNVEHEKERPL